MFRRKATSIQQSWVTDEDCLDPQSFVDYQALDLLLDTAQPCEHYQQSGLTILSPLRLSSLTESDVPSFAYWMFDPLGLDHSYFVDATRSLLREAMPALIKLRDRNVDGFQLTIVTLPTLLTRESMERASRHSDVDEKCRSLLLKALQIAEFHLKSKLSYEDLGYASLLLRPLFSQWRRQVEAYFLQLSLQLVAQAERYSRNTRRKAFAEYAGLARYVSGLTGEFLANSLAAAGADPSEYLPYFSLQARASVFSADLGL